LEHFSVAAAKFHADTGSHSTLIFDNVEFLAGADEQFLRTLQEEAMVAGVKGLFKTVFVCSDGEGLSEMRRES